MKQLHNSLIVTYFTGDMLTAFAFLIFLHLLTVQIIFEELMSYLTSHCKGNHMKKKCKPLYLSPLSFTHKNYRVEF
jgi:hypothetical protein